jgi:hypothetical protein
MVFNATFKLSEFKITTLDLFEKPLKKIISFRSFILSISHTLQQKMLKQKKAVYPNVEISGVRLCCLIPLSAIFQLYRGGQFSW